METQRKDILWQIWRACLGFALSQIAVALLMVVLSTADPTLSHTDLRGSLAESAGIGDEQAQDTQG